MVIICMINSYHWVFFWPFLRSQSVEDEDFDMDDLFNMFQEDEERKDEFEAEHGAK